LLIADSGLAAEIDRALAELGGDWDDRVWVVGGGADSPRRGAPLQALTAAEPAGPCADALPGGGYNVMVYTSGTTGRPKGIERTPLPWARGPAPGGGAP